MTVPEAADQTENEVDAKLLGPAELAREGDGEAGRGRGRRPRDAGDFEGAAGAESDPV